MYASGQEDALRSREASRFRREQFRDTLFAVPGELTRHQMCTDVKTDRDEWEESS